MCSVAAIASELISDSEQWVRLTGKLAAGGGGRHGKATVNPASSAAAPDRSNLDIVVNAARKGLKL